MKVLIVGAAGQLGQAMVARLRASHDVTAWVRADVDLTHHAAVRDAVARLAPEAIVNCSGYNNVDQAEDDQVTAFEVNAMAVGTLSRAAAALDAVFLHYSTDFVFAGTSSTPYSEADAPEPRSVYAQSKLVGEWFAAETPRHYVLRVESLFGGPNRKSSIDRIVNGVRSGVPPPVFFDRVVSPSFVTDVADASAFMLETQPQWGVYHCVNAGHGTWFDVGMEIASKLGAPVTALSPVSIHDVSLRAARPQYAALSNAKLARAGYVMPTWQNALDRYLTL